MAKVKTSELTGPALDWAVAKCEEGEDLAEGWHPHTWVRGGQHELRDTPYSPSTDWAQGGPIIEREGINLSVDYQDDALSTDMVQIGWKGNLWNNSVPGTSGFLQWAYGPTPLIAAMRCYVASKLGDEVDVPEELKLQANKLEELVLAWVEAASKGWHIAEDMWVTDPIESCDTYSAWCTDCNARLFARTHKRFPHTLSEFYEFEAEQQAKAGGTQ